MLKDLNVQGRCMYMSGQGANCKATGNCRGAGFKHTVQHWSVLRRLSLSLFDYWPLVLCVSSHFWNRRNYIVLGEGQGAGEKSAQSECCVLASILFWMIEMHDVNLAVSITRQGCNLLLQYSIPEYLFTELPIMNISGYYSNYVFNYRPLWWRFSFLQLHKRKTYLMV